MAELIRERYEPVEVVGRGGQGEVVLAIDRLHDRRVALKVRATGSEDERQGLLQEAGILLGVRPHPNLPLVREDFISGERSYIVMDWVEGRNLSRVLAEEGTPGLPLERVLDFIDQAAQALDHLHDHEPPVVHRDVKPANLILTREGRVVLVDFGISARWGSGDRETGQSPAFSAPELTGGATTPAADVYSLGATAFALLTGDRPRPEVKPRIAGAPPHVEDAILRVLRRALTVNPNRRQPSAGAFAEALRAAAGAAPPKRRRTLMLSASGAAVAVLVAVAAFLFAGAPALSAVAVGSNPAGVVVDPQSNRVYVANSGSRSVSVVDGATKRVVASVAVGSRPEAIAVIPKTGRVYVANGDATVSVIDGKSAIVVATVDVGSRPQGIATNPRTNEIFVATSDSAVAVIDGDTNKVVRTIAMTSRPRGIAVSPEKGRIYVSGEQPNTVSILDREAGAAVGAVPVQDRPCGIAVSHKQNRVYVAGHDSETVVVIDGDTRTVVSTIRVGADPCGIAVNAQTGRVYVGHDTGMVTAIDGTTDRVVASRRVVEAQRTAGLLLNQVTVDPQEHRIYIVDKESDRLLIIAEKDL